MVCVEGFAMAGCLEAKKMVTIGNAVFSIIFT